MAALLVITIANVITKPEGQLYFYGLIVGVTEGHRNLGIVIDSDKK